MTDDQQETGAFATRIGFLGYVAVQLYKGALSHSVCKDSGSYIRYQRPSSRLHFADSVSP